MTYIYATRRLKPSPSCHTLHCVRIINASLRSQVHLWSCSGYVCCHGSPQQQGGSAQSHQQWHHWLPLLYCLHCHLCLLPAQPVCGSHLLRVQQDQTPQHSWLSFPHNQAAGTHTLCRPCSQHASLLTLSRLCTRQKTTHFEIHYTIICKVPVQPVNCCI